jgi:hypothetical protein
MSSSVWGIKETKMYPAKWFGGPLRNGEPADNATCYYHRTLQEAVQFVREHEPKCSCGNPEMGFDCTCKWSEDHPGNNVYTCGDGCGIYDASKPRCNRCKTDENNERS